MKPYKYNKFLPAIREEAETSVKAKLIRINARFLKLLKKEYDNVINDRIDDAGKVVQIRQRD